MNRLALPLVAAAALLSATSVGWAQDVPEDPHRWLEDVRSKPALAWVEEQNAVQIEHLIGELTAHLSTNFLQVRRNGRYSRFLPVKTPEDLQSAQEEIADMYDGGDDDGGDDGGGDQV